MTMPFMELKPSELTLAIEDAINSNVVALILGSPGTGKSDIVDQTITRMKRKQIYEQVSIMDSTDWRGVPDIDRKAKQTVWYPPAFLPTDPNDDSVVFLDEITQVQAQCQSPLYQVLLNGRLGTVWTKPKNVRFLAAGNYLDDGTFANKLGAALRDRMVTLRLKVDVDDWCRWAYEAGVAPVVIAFIRFRTNLLYAFKKEEWVSPTARGWEFVSRLVLASKHNGRVRDALIEGKVGHAAMIEFTGFEQIFSKCPSIDAILLNPDTVDLPSKPELCYAVCNALSQKATVSNLDRICIYLNRMPSEEYGVFTVKTALRRDPKLAHTPAFNQWVVAHAEAMA